MISPRYQERQSPVQSSQLFRIRLPGHLTVHPSTILHLSLRIPSQPFRPSSSRLISSTNPHASASKSRRLGLADSYCDYDLVACWRLGASIPVPVLFCNSSPAVSYSAASNQVILVKRPRPCRHWCLASISLQCLP